MKKLKSKTKHVFVVSISDSFCEYSYDLPVSGDYSIREIWRKISKAFRVIATEGRFRK